MRELQHPGEFLISEGNGTISREEGVLVHRVQPYLDGTFLASFGDGLVEWDSDEVADIVGILYGSYTTRPDDVQSLRCVYIARNAEVKDQLLRYSPEDDDEWRSLIRAELERRNIIPRVPGEYPEPPTEPTEPPASSEAPTGPESEATSEAPSEPATSEAPSEPPATSEPTEAPSEPGTSEAPSEPASEAMFLTLETGFARLQGQPMFYDPPLQRTLETGFANAEGSTLATVGFGIDVSIASLYAVFRRVPTIALNSGLARLVGGAMEANSFAFGGVEASSANLYLVYRN